MGDSILDDDDLPEALDSISPFQSEDEVFPRLMAFSVLTTIICCMLIIHLLDPNWLCQENAQSIKSIIPRTMADQFHEAFGTVSITDDRLHVAFPRPLWWVSY